MEIFFGILILLFLIYMTINFIRDVTGADSNDIGGLYYFFRYIFVSSKSNNNKSKGIVHRENAKEPMSSNTITSTSITSQVKTKSGIQNTLTNPNFLDEAKELLMKNEEKLLSYKESIQLLNNAYYEEAENIVYLIKQNLEKQILSNKYSENDGKKIINIRYIIQSMIFAYSYKIPEYALHIDKEKFDFLDKEILKEIKLYRLDTSYRFKDKYTNNIVSIYSGINGNLITLGSLIKCEPKRNGGIIKLTDNGKCLIKTISKIAIEQGIHCEPYLSVKQSGLGGGVDSYSNFENGSVYYRNLSLDDYFDLTLYIKAEIKIPI